MDKMDPGEAKRKKRNQVLQTLLVTIAFWTYSIYIILTAPADNPGELMRYLLSRSGYGYNATTVGFIIILAIFATAFFFLELKDYLRGNYKLWKTSKK
jgi:hypothetical protein